MVRLTADLINKSLSYINPLQERELGLRGQRLSEIQNLGAATDQDAIDFTDNEIIYLGNFPLLPRIKALYFARNRIASVQAFLAKTIPNLHTLTLTENAINDLADLSPLGDFKKLVHLSLYENPVSRKENYRYWVVWLCPTVRFLDFKRVIDSERRKAKELFGTPQESSELAREILGASSSTTINYGSGTVNGTAKARITKMTDKEKQKITELILKTTNMMEIARLEKALNEGIMPTGILDNDSHSMDTT